MANYTKLTDFASKDSLPTGTPAKIVKGTEIDDEFQAIETSIATKADLASPTFTGTATIPTATVTTATVTTANITNAAVSGTSTVDSKTVAVLGLAQNFAAAQRTAPTTINLSSSQVADLSTSNVFIVNVQGDYSLTTSDMATGGCYVFIINNTGAYDINFGSEFYFSGGEPTITSGAGSKDLVSCVSDGTNLYCSINYDLEAS